MRTPTFFLLLFTFLTLSSSNPTEIACQKSDDCSSLQSCHQNICVQKELFPMTPREVFGTFITVIINVLMTLGGVGAGAGYAPIVQSLFQTTLSKAFAICFSCVFGAGVANLLSIIKAKNPKTNRYSINYDVNLVVLPALMIGVSIGSMVSRVLPPVVVKIALLFVLGYSLFNFFFQWRSTVQKEKAARREQPKVHQMPSLKQLEEAKPSQNIATTPIESILELGIKLDITEAEQEKNEKEQAPQEAANTASASKAFNRNYAKLPSIVAKAPVTILEVDSQSEIPDKDDEKNCKGNSQPESINTISTANTFSRVYSRMFSSIIVKESRTSVEEEVLTQSNSSASKRDLLYAQEQKYPFAKLSDLSNNILSMIIFGLIRGSKNFKPIIRVDWSPSWDFAWFSLGTFCFCLATAKSVYSVMKSQKEKQSVNYEFLPEEPLLNRKRMTTLVLVSIVAGFVSGTSTIGAAMIIGTALLKMGMPPGNMGVTVSVFMIFSMFNTMFGTILNGVLPAQEIAWFMSLSFIFSMVSSQMMNYYLKKTGRVSAVLFLMLSAIIVATLCLIGTMMHSLIKDLPEQVKVGSIY